MNIGHQIRNIRKKLKLTQGDLAGPGVSRVYITDLESGKAHLDPNIPNKVARAYHVGKRLLHFSLLKNIKIEDAFFEFFQLDHEYNIIIACYEDIFYVRNNKDITNEELTTLRHKYLSLNTDFFKFYLLVAIGHAYKRLKNNKEASKTFKVALTSAKYKVNKEVINFYNQTIFDFMPYANDEANASLVVDLYSYVVEYSLLNKIAVERYAYYNIALFCNKAFRYDESIDYLYQQINHYNETDEDKITNNILMAGNFMKLNKLDEAWEIFQDLFLLQGDNLSYQMLIYSNFINFITKYDYGHREALQNAVSKVEVLIAKEAPTVRVSHYTHANIGQGYEYLGLTDDAYYNFNKAFDKYLESGKSKYNYLMIIYEAYPTYRKKDRIDELLDHLQTFDFNDLSENEKILYMKILINIQGRSDNDKYNQLIKDIII